MRISDWSADGCSSDLRAKARDMCVFTTHTPVEAGHDRFGYELVEQVTRDLVPIAELKELAGGDALNMTRLALNLCGYVNGVARRHATPTRDMFPGYSVDSVTNGVHSATWPHPAFASMFEAEIPPWTAEPGLRARADPLADAHGMRPSG